MPICNIILYMYIVHSSAMQAEAKIVVINMTFVCHGQDCNSILLGPATSGANELIVFRSHSICNFQFKIGPPGMELTWTCILCYAVRIRLLKLLATRKKNERHKNMVEALNLLYSLYTGTQLMIGIIDARSIANAYYYGVTYAQQGLQRMRRSTPCALQR